MPVRDMDMYADFLKPSYYVEANRGASGIDGTLSSAIGYATGLQKPVTLLMGDLAMIHDLNALSQFASREVKLIIVVINNHGGGIFSFLPIADFPDVFGKYFATPHTFSFKHAADMFQLAYQLVETNEEFRGAYQDSIKSGKSVLIEAVTDQQENVQIQRDLQKRISHAINRAKR